MLTLPGAQTVKRQSPGESGGTPQVPDLSPFSDSGANALMAFGRKLKERADKIAEREAQRDALEAEDAFNTFTLTTYNDTDTQQDLSDEGIQMRFAGTLETRRAELVNQFAQKHGAFYGADLENRLSHLTSVAVDKSIIRGLEIRDAKIAQIAGRFLNGLAARARDGEDTDQLIEDGRAWFEKNRKSMRPEQELAYANNVGKRIYGGQIDRHIRLGQFDKAEDLLEDPKVQIFVDEGDQRNWFERITLAKKAVADKLQAPVKGIPRDVWETFSKEQKLRIAGAEPTRETIKGVPADIIRDAVNNKMVTSKQVLEWLGFDVKTPKEKGQEAGEQKKAEAEAIKGEPLAEDEEIRLAGVEPKLLEVADPTEEDPTRTTFVPESEARGQHGRRRGPLVSFINPSTFRDKLAESDVKVLREDIEKTARRAVRQKSENKRIRAALESGKFTPGVFARQRLFLSRFANFLEIDISPESELGKWIGDAEAADTLDAAANRLAVEGAEKMPRITNMGIQFIKDSLPGLMRTPEGNEILIAVMDRIADREIEIANLADEYIAKYSKEPNPLRPEGKRSFFQATRDLERDDPVITPELEERMRKGAKRGGKSFREIIESARTGQPPKGFKAPEGWEFDSVNDKGQIVLRDKNNPNRTVTSDTVVDQAK